MKDKILVFIIGLLVGAVVTASGFLIYEKNNQNLAQAQTQNQETMQMMERPDGEKPPEKLDGSWGNENRPEPRNRNNTMTENRTN